MALSGLLTRVPAALARGHAIKSSESLFLRLNSSISCRSNLLSVLSGRNKCLLLDKKLKGYLVPCCASRTHTHAKTSKEKGFHIEHSGIWRLEKLASFILIPIVPAALLKPCDSLDTVLAIVAVMHNHWGMESIAVDYVRPILFGNIIPKIARGSVYIVSIVTLTGLLSLIYNGEGLANAILHFWNS